VKLENEVDKENVTTISMIYPSQQLARSKDEMLYVSIENQQHDLDRGIRYYVSSH